MSWHICPTRTRLCMGLGKELYCGILQWCIPSETYSKLKLHSSVTSISVAKPFWNFTQSSAVTLPCSVLNSKTIWQPRNYLSANELWRNLSVRFRFRWPFLYCNNSRFLRHVHSLDIYSKQCRADSRFAPSQWETTLLCNDVSHWLGARLKSTLQCIILVMECSSGYSKGSCWI